MKKSMSFILLMLIIGVGSTALFIGCGSKEHKQEQSIEEGGANEEVAYACPMHPEEIGKKDDTCSKCGMALEEVKDTDSDTTAHDHEDDHH